MPRLIVFLSLKHVFWRTIYFPSGTSDLGQLQNSAHLQINQSNLVIENLHQNLALYQDLRYYALTNTGVYIMQNIVVGGGEWPLGKKIKNHR